MIDVFLCGRIRCARSPRCGVLGIIGVDLPPAIASVPGEAEFMTVFGITTSSDSSTHWRHRRTLRNSRLCGRLRSTNEAIVRVCMCRFGFFNLLKT
jgi:hypothetical protein